MGVWSPFAAPDVRSMTAWNEKLRGRGHWLRWERISPDRHRGVCGRCGAGIECGIGQATPAGSADIRKIRRCGQA